MSSPQVPTQKGWGQQVHTLHCWSPAMPVAGLRCGVAEMTGVLLQHGRLEYGTALCHRDFRSCAIGAMAMYFFWQWHCSGEAFPSFGASEDWYQIKALKRDMAN